MAGAFLCAPASVAVRQLARRPPMSGNGYDAYRTSITEAHFRANVRLMARHLLRYGWRYAVIDAEWFVRNPTSSGGARKGHCSSGCRQRPARYFLCARAAAAFSRDLALGGYRPTLA
ncbi:glycoside hydrolase, clan GH-D, partial [mine drainage metagenome]